jgi:hypothetical protein
MSNYCSHCGFANAKNAVRCENCKLFVGVSPEDKDIRSFSGIRLMGILVVIGFLTFAGYQTFKSPPPPKPTPKWQTDAMEKMREKERQEINQRRSRGY